MKVSGAPEVGDLVRYRWPEHEDPLRKSWHEVTALVVGERGIWVRILPFGKIIPQRHDHLYFSQDEPGTERWIARTQCEIIRTRQGEIVNSTSSA